MDTTTGMSPPPMAATRCTPRARAMTVMTTRQVQAAGEPSGRSAKATMRPRDTSSAARLSRLRPGSVMGRPGILPASLRAAMTDPVKVTAPTNTPRKTSPKWKAPRDSDRASGAM